VEGVPRRVVGVAHERLDQERPHPACVVLRRPSDQTTWFANSGRPGVTRPHGGGHMTRTHHKLELPMPLASERAE
jgi:hypothetical protein